MLELFVSLGTLQASGLAAAMQRHPSFSIFCTFVGTCVVYVRGLQSYRYFWRLTEIYVTAAFPIALYFCCKCIKKATEWLYDPADRVVAPFLSNRFAALGGLFVKAGQWLANMAATPLVWTDHLKKLQDCAPKDTESYVKAMLEAEFGKNFKDIFLEFEFDPVASASIAQVHRAIMRDTGEQVAVKLQHEGVEPMMLLDLDALKRVLAFSCWLGGNDWDEIKSITEGWMKEMVHELDFHREVENLREVPALPFNVVVPKEVEGLVSRRAFIMEFCEGFRFTDLDQLALWGVDRKALSERAVHAVACQLLEIGVFNSDPHGGNLLCQIQDKSAVPVLLDFGNCIRLPEEQRLLYCRLLVALGDGSMSSVVEATKKLGIITSQTEAHPARDMEYMMMVFRDTGSRKSQIAGLKSFRELRKSQRSADMEALDEKTKKNKKKAKAQTQRYPKKMPEEAVLFLRMMLLVRGLCSQLDAELPFLQLFEQHARRALVIRFPTIKRALPLAISGVGIMACQKELTALEQYVKKLKQDVAEGKTKCRGGTRMLFPMYTMPSEKVLNLQELRPHEALLEEGQIVEFGDHMGNAAFVSHQWICSRHPDPDLRQFRQLQGTLRKIMTTSSSYIDPDISTEFAAPGFALYYRGDAEMVQLLLDAKADMNEKMTMPLSTPYGLGWTILGIQRRFGAGRRGAHVGYHAFGSTPLMFAILTGQHEGAAVLLAAKAKVDVQNSRGWTALDLAKEHGAPQFLIDAIEGDLTTCSRIATSALTNRYPDSTRTVPQKSQALNHKATAHVAPLVRDIIAQLVLERPGLGIQASVYVGDACVVDECGGVLGSTDPRPMLRSTRIPLADLSRLPWLLALCSAEKRGEIKYSDRLLTFLETKSACTVSLADALSHRAIQQDGDDRDAFISSPVAELEDTKQMMKKLASSFSAQALPGARHLPWGAGYVAATALRQLSNKSEVEALKEYLPGLRAAEELCLNSSTGEDWATLSSGLFADLRSLASGSQNSGSGKIFMGPVLGGVGQKKAKEKEAEAGAAEDANSPSPEKDIPKNTGHNRQTLARSVFEDAGGLLADVGLANATAKWSAEVCPDMSCASSARSLAAVLASASPVSQSRHQHSQEQAGDAAGSSMSFLFSQLAPPARAWDERGLQVIELENTSHPAVGESQRLLVQTMVEDIQL
eukprot:symbB.v1.2.004816.t1/scaffold279.1/size242841/1